MKINLAKRLTASSVVLEFTHANEIVCWHHAKRPKEKQMNKSQIYAIRAQVHGAMHFANDNKIIYSPLIRMEWKNYGYIPVSARYLA
jgi:hypothetical protein